MVSYIKSFFRGSSSHAVSDASQKGASCKEKTVAKQILQSAALHEETMSLPISRRVIRKKTELHTACETGDNDRVRELIKTESLETEDSEGITPLVYACYAGSPAIVRLLLENTDDPRRMLDQPAPGGGTIIHAALAAYFQAKDPKRKKACHEVIEILIRNGASIEGKNLYGQTPLLVACDHQDLSLIEFLMSNGANIHAVDMEGNTAIHNLCRGRAPEKALFFFLKHECDLNLLNQQGESPLSIACANNSLETVRLLLKNGASPNTGATKYNGDMTYYFPPLFHACRHKNQEMAALLLESGAHADQQLKTDQRMITPLIVACTEIDNDKIIECLLGRGATANFSSLRAEEYAVQMMKSPSYKKYFKTKDDKRLRNLKKISNANSVGNHPSVAIECEGGKAHIFYRDFANVLQRRTMLAHALLEASRNPVDGENAAARIRRGELVILPAGWRGHAIAVVFYKGYLAIINRGEGSENCSTAEFYRIDDYQKIDGRFIDKIMKQDKSDVEKGKKFFYEELPKTFASSGEAVQDELCQILRQEMALSEQGVGNCPFASAEGAIPAAMALVAFVGEKRALPRPEKLEAIRQTAHEASLQMRMIEVEKFLSLEPKKPLHRGDAYVINHAWKAIKTDLQKSSQSLEAYPKIQERLSEPEKPLKYKAWKAVMGVSEKARETVGGLAMQFLPIPCAAG